MPSWKITALASKAAVEAALARQELVPDWPGDVVVSGSETAEDRPEEWRLEMWLPRKPDAADQARAKALFGRPAPRLSVERLADEDWVSLSQQGAQPIVAGRFRVRTPEHAASGDPALTEFVIPTSLAFGTGQHGTTAGCLAMLDRMRREGVVARDIADIGTGTGLLAFAALALWPHARATATDIDPVCADVVHANAAANRVREGAGTGALATIVADGMDDPLIAARGPYDLLIANILAGPLIDLAPDFAHAVPPGGHVVLAGLLETQEPAVRRAYRHHGFRLARRLVNGDWSILWLRRSGVR